MTLKEIVSAAMTLQNASTDAQMMDHYFEKYSNLANDGLVDLAEHLHLRRTDTQSVDSNGEINIDSLPDECVKVISVRQGGSPVEFSRGSCTQKLKVDASGDVQVEYRYVPARLSSDTDVPAIPERMHTLLVTYICARDITSQDETSQRRANQFYELYNVGKQRARQAYGEPDDYRIINKF